MTQKGAEQHINKVLCRFWCSHYKQNNYLITYQTHFRCVHICLYMLSVKSMDRGVRDREMNDSKRKRENVCEWAISIQINGTVSVSPLFSSHYEMRTCTPLGKLLCLGSLMYSFLVRLKNLSSTNLHSSHSLSRFLCFIIYAQIIQKENESLMVHTHCQGSWYLKAEIYCAVTAFNLTTAMKH